VGGKSSQTVGYRYYMSLHMGIGRGPVNEIADIWVGGLSLLDGQSICIANSGQLVAINKGNLFGGDDKEGGIAGGMYVYNGARDQELQPEQVVTGVSGGAAGGKSGLYSGLFGFSKLPAIADSLGGDVPNFRGVVTCWYDGLVCSMNPYPKEWSFRVRRTTAGWWGDTAWYPAKATIPLVDENGNTIIGMNPAHMIYEVNTNPEWGRGMPPELLDENSFIAAANTLCSEQFGLCMPWFRQETIKEFLPVIVDHIGAVQYLDRQTGKLALKLIRNDYDPDDLPIFGPDSGLLRIEEDDSSSEETAFNEIIVKGFSPATKEDISVTIHNLGSIQSLGETISNTIEYKGLPTRELVARVAQRELRLQTSQRKLTCYFDRRAWKITPGMPFKIVFPGKGIAEMIVRAGEIADNGPTNGEIQIKVVQDIFGMPSTSYVTPQAPVWAGPNFVAAPAADEKIIELDYRSVYKQGSGQVTIPEGSGYIGVLARPPEGVSTSSYDLATKAGTEDYVIRANGGYTAAVTLVADIGPLDTTATLDLNDEFLTEFYGEPVVLIGDEQVGITDIDTDTGVVTIKRGVADTIPAEHLAGATVWLLDDEIVSDNREYVDSDVVDAKALVRTSADLLPLDDAAEMEIIIDQRVNRPYPPGNVKIDGQSIYAMSGEHNEPILTISHRDRLVQADVVVGHTEASIGPETGVEYEVKVYDKTGVTLLRTETFATDTWTYDASMIAADGNPTRVVMELRSTRDGLTSLFYYRFTVVINGGWGLAWGMNWGG